MALPTASGPITSRTGGRRPAAVLAPKTAAAGSDAPVKLAFVPGLDGLRGLAVLLVIGIHFRPSLMAGGWIGVNLFFVLSGFLITSLLLREWALRGGINLGRFYLRRALRLLPAMFALLGVCVAYAYFTESSSAFSRTLVDARAVLLYFYNWHLALH